MTDLILYGSFALLVLLFVGAFILTRRSVRSLGFLKPLRRGPDLSDELITELRRTNDLVASMVQDHEARLARLEHELAGRKDEA